MESTSSSAEAPSVTVNRGGAASSKTYRRRASKLIMSTAKEGESVALLGTPQERLAMLQNEIKNGSAAGLVIRFDSVQLPDKTPYLVITIRNAWQCKTCGWWNVGADKCQNEKCQTNEATAPSVPVETPPPIVPPEIGGEKKEK